MTNSFRRKGDKKNVYGASKIDYFCAVNKTNKDLKTGNKDNTICLQQF